MTTTQAVYGLVTVLLSGGLGAGVASLITSRALARKTTSETNAIDAKLPAEVDSVVVQGAESAVLTMKAALDSATGRIAQLETERTADAGKIRDLEGKVEQLRRKVTAAEKALAVATEATAALQRELAEFVAEQSQRQT